MNGGRDGEDEHVLAEWNAPKRLFWEQPKSTNHRYWSKIGLQEALSVPIW